MFRPAIMKTQLTRPGERSEGDRIGTQTLGDSRQDNISNATIVALVAATAVLGIVLWILVAMRFRA